MFGGFDGVFQVVSPNELVHDIHLKLWMCRRNAKSSSSTAWITTDNKCPYDPNRTAGAVSDFSPRVYTSKDPLRGALQVDTLLVAAQKSR